MVPILAALAGYVTYDAFVQVRRSDLEKEIMKTRIVLESELSDTRKNLQTTIKKLEKIQPLSPQEELLERKKKEFLSLAGVSFIYVDREAIKDAYNISFKEPTVESLVQKLVEEQEGELGSGEGTGLILKGRLGGKSLTEYVKKIKLPETTIPEMFVRYQRHIIENVNAKYGFDEIAIKLERVSKFESDLVKLCEHFSVSVPNDFIKAKKEEIKRTLVESALADLEEIDQFVILAGKYKVSPDGEKVYKFTYDHPINAYLTHMPDTHVQISCFLEKNRIEDSYKPHIMRIAQKNQVIPAKIFGKVLQPIDRKSKNWELQVVPFAIY